MSLRNRNKVVVAGAGGSIGSVVCRSLTRGYDVVALVVARERLPDSETASSISWVAWVADTFFKWLPRFARPFVLCEVDASGICRIFNRLPRLNLLTLSFQPDRSSPDRRIYLITGGLLARGHDQLQPRFEFRDVMDGRYTIAAIHDFRPRLPWGFYNLTQAAIHLLVMRTFQIYMQKKMA